MLNYYMLKYPLKQEYGQEAAVPLRLTGAVYSCMKNVEGGGDFYPLALLAEGVLSLSASVWLTGCPAVCPAARLAVSITLLA